MATSLFYGLFFSDPAAGAAAIAANGGSVTLNVSPEHALGLNLAPGGVILNLANPFLGTVPGQVNVGTFLAPQYVLTLPDSTTIPGNNGSPFVWSGSIIAQNPSAPVQAVPTVDNVSNVVPSGKFEIAMVTWTGDGSSNRLIATPFSLASGLVAVWGCGGIDKAGGFNGECNFMRHNATSMLGTALCGLLTSPVSGGGVDGITGFSAAGFTVSAGSDVYTYGNTTNVKYIAVVLRDTTNDKRYLQIGNYKGLLNGSFRANCTHGVAAITYFDGLVWNAGLSGLKVQDTSSNIYTFTVIDANNATLSPPFIPGSQIATLTLVDGIPGAQRVITTQPSGARPVTHVWVWGSTCSYKSVDIPAAKSVALLSGGSGTAPNNLHITAIGAGTFTITDGENTLNNIYSYLGLCADAFFLAQHFFQSVAGVSTAASQIVPWLFTASLGFARQGSPIFTDGAMWQAARQATTPTTSLRCAITAGSNNDTNGLTGLPVNGIQVGVEASSEVNGDPFYLWAWHGNGTGPGDGLGPGGSNPSPTANASVTLQPTFTVGTPPGGPFASSPCGSIT